MAKSSTEIFLEKAGYAPAGAQGGNDIRTILAGLIQVALSFVGVIFFLVILYGGYLWLTAGGNEEQVKKARTYILRAVVGFVIVLLALIITRTVAGILTESATAPAGEVTSPSAQQGIQNFLNQ